MNFDIRPNAPRSLVNIRTLPFIMALLVSCLPLGLGFMNRGAAFAQAGDIDDETISRNMPVILAWGAVYLTTAWSAYMRFGVVWRSARQNLLVSAFLMLVVCSIAYDQYPVRAAAVAFAFFAAFFSASLAVSDLQDDPLRLAKILVVVLGVLNVANFLFVILLHDLAVDIDGRWTGFYGNANALGGEAFLVFTASLVLKVVGREKSKLLWAVLVISALNLLGSDSKTSILAATIMPAILLMERLRIRSIGLFVLLPLLLISVGLFGALVGWEKVAASMGRNLTLSGRTTAWVFGAQMIIERPLIGYGVSDTRHFLFDAGVPSTNFHNSYVELAVRLGILGWLLFLLFVGKAIFSAIRWYGVDRNFFWIMSFLLGILMMGLTESVVFSARSSVFVVFWLCILLISRLSQPDARKAKHNQTTQVFL